VERFIDHLSFSIYQFQFMEALALDERNVAMTMNDSAKQERKITPQMENDKRKMTNEK
jgi:hypothetical protein